MRTLLCLTLLLLAPVGAAGDELRLKDGEILVGAVEEESKGRISIRTHAGLRRIRVEDVAERIPEPEGDTAWDVRRKSISDDDGEALVALALDAWHARRDEAAASYAILATMAPAAGDALQLAFFLSEHRAKQSTKQHGGPTRQRWGPAKREALVKGGGNSTTEKRVRLALDWLAPHQDEDGKLDADGFQRHDPDDDRCDGQGGGHHGGRVPCPYDGATTAVALMAWLASGSTHLAGPYQENVERALRFCLRQIASGPASAYGMWNHGFCTQAVADAYMLSRDSTLRAPLQVAVQGILRLQRSDGGWSYYMSIGDVPTTAVAGCALGLAARAGILVPPERVNRLMGFLDARVNPKRGRSEYHKGAERKGYTPTRANTAAGLSVRAHFGILSEARLRTSQVGALRGQKPVWKLAFKEVKTGRGQTVRAQVGNLYPYLWYYTSMALFSEGGAAWSSWFGSLKKALLKGQRRKGSAAGSWDPLGTYSNSAGRVFITGLCTLMLQTPYRYAR